MTLDEFFGRLEHLDGTPVKLEDWQKDCIRSAWEGTPRKLRDNGPPARKVNRHFIHVRMVAAAIASGKSIDIADTDPRWAEKVRREALELLDRLDGRVTPKWPGGPT